MIKTNKKNPPNLYREHDQDVSNDSDQTQRSGHQDDEHYLHRRVWTSREEAGVFSTADIGGVGWIQTLHPVSSHIPFSQMLQARVTSVLYLVMKKIVEESASLQLFYSYTSDVRTSLCLCVPLSAHTVTDAKSCVTSSVLAGGRCLSDSELAAWPRCEAWTGEQIKAPAAAFRNIQHILISGITRWNWFGVYMKICTVGLILYM